MSGAAALPAPRGRRGGRWMGRAVSPWRHAPRLPRSPPCHGPAPQVEAVIGEHRAELLAERYHFNMGLLMGECGAPGQPLPGTPAPLDPESQPFAVGCPGPSCCIAASQPTRRRGDVLPCPPRRRGCGWQPPVVPCARGSPGARAASGRWLRRPASAALAEAPRAGPCPSPTGCPVRRGGAEPAAVGGREDHQERGGPAGGCEGSGSGAAWGGVPCRCRARCGTC